MFTKKQLEEFIEIQKDNPMSSKLPKSYNLQENINKMFELDKDTYEGNGIRVMDLGKRILLKLNLEILKLKNEK